MYCPKCGAEYVEGIKECADCHVTLVDKVELKSAPEPEDDEFVTILSAGNFPQFLVAESLLRSAGIVFYSKGERLQSLFGWGSMMIGYDPIVGPMQIQVAKKDAATARELLKDLR